jgi:hypothetical protein
VLNTKNYYQKRIRELEDKYKFKMGGPIEGVTEQPKVVEKVREVKSVLKKTTVDADVEQAA